MATETVPRANERLLIDVVDSIAEADFRVALVKWIEKARAVLDDLQDSANLDPDLRAALKRQDVRYGLRWDQDASEGLTFLHNDISERLLDVKTQSEAPRHAQ